MNDKELIKKVIPLLLDRDSRYRHIHSVSEKSTRLLAKIFKCRKREVELDLNLSNLIDKYPEIFSLYGIKTVDNGYGKHLEYLDQPIHY